MEFEIAFCYLRPAGRGFILILALYRLGAIHVYSLAPSRCIESLPSRLGTTTPTKTRASQRLLRPVCRRAVERFAGTLLGSLLLLYLSERFGMAAGAATRIGSALNAAVYLSSVFGGVVAYR